MAEKLSMESKNILSENIENIASLFPNALVETEDGKKIDFDILRQELSGDIVEGTKERYHLDFPGKREAIAEANRKINKTLRPIKEKSVDFDNTKNIYIEGDNLEALKILQESYLGKIKCIYIDPPYNTGNDFVYNDKFSHTTEEELKASGRMDEDGNILISKDINNDSNGRYHSDWLKMMYPRLKLARNLLSDDGVIFISIDDNELDNLRKLCDEIYGESNFINIFPRKTVEIVRTLADYELQNLNDFVVMYAKNINQVNIIKDVTGSKEYEHEDKNGKYTLKSFQNSGENGTRTARPNLYYPIYYNENNNKFSLTKKSDDDIEILPKKVMHDDGRWLWSKEKFENDNNLLEFKNGTIYRKVYYNEEEDQNKYQAKKTWIDNLQNRLGAKALKDFGIDGCFDYSKPVELIKYLISMIVCDGDIVLDFFSGSATTAQATFEYEIDKGYKNSFILVQLNETLNLEAESISKNDQSTKKNALKFCKNNKLDINLCSIGEERIRRAGKKIKEENPMLTQNLDTGFRVYKVDSSNMKDIYYTPDKIDQVQILDMVSNVKEDRTAEDLLTQVILNLGLPLDLHIDEKMVGKNKLFFCRKNALVACFDETIDLSILDEIEKVKPLKICLRESSFTKDQDKINFFEKLKKLSPDTEATTI